MTKETVAAAIKRAKKTDHPLLEIRARLWAELSAKTAHPNELARAYGSPSQQEWGLAGVCPSDAMFL